jgi:esterase/lipase superfamily enzyme
VQPIAAESIRVQVGAALSGAGSKSVLLFVHGFNVTFTDAALRTAQLAHDLSFGGVPFFFSWPSAGETRSYFRDEEIAQLSDKDGTLAASPAMRQLYRRCSDDFASFCSSDLAGTC